ncbi:MAG: ribonuclease P protein component [Rickettsiales bacterium]|nr:ribonuclease P protein component [Rickettsiales bacterium]
MVIHATLKKRKQFVYINNNCTKSVRRGLILQAVPSQLSDTIRVGYTVTKKVGVAVIRNKAKRRLRAAWRIVSADAKPEYDYVLIGRFTTIDRDFDKLVNDLRNCLKELDLLLSE